VALIHAYIDFCGLVSSGLYTTSSISGVMDEISPLSLVMALFYVLLAIFLLRPKKLQRMVFQPRPATQGEILMLMVVLFLAAGLFSAVMVLSL
jgi:drug/metabolite transporter (DMT)-like permease